MTSQSFAELVAAGDYSSAVKVLDGAIDETRADYAAALHRLVQLHVNRGICNQNLHLNRKALKDFDAAIALMPSNVSALLRKGQVLQALGKAAEARVVWQTAISVADPASDLTTLAEIHAALQGKSAATTALAAADSTPSSTAASAELLSRYSTANGSITAPDVPVEPQPEVAAAAAAEANGVVPATPPAAVSSAAPSTSLSSSTAQPAPAAAPAAAGKSSMAKGFFKGQSDPAAKQSSTTVTTSTASTNSSSRKSRSSADGDAVVEIDCAQQQRGNGNSTKSGGGTFGAQVQQMAQNSVALQIAINQINSGQVEQAEQLLDGILSGQPNELSALVARGTARALRRKLKEAVEDFTKAIAIEPRYPDTYKRRGQALSALGDHKGALEDLEKAAKLLKDLPGADQLVQGGGEADCYAERGMLYQKLRDYRKAVRELTKATDLDTKNAQAWNYLGLCKVSMGDIREGCRAYERAIDLQPNMKEAWLNMGQALKEEGRVKEAERALTKAMTAADGQPCLAAYRLLATMRQGQGRQSDAIKVLDKALNYQREEQKIELLYLRAICYHALGYIRKAVADYEMCMNSKLRVEEGPVAEESRMFQFLSFYQREMALFLYHNLGKKSVDFCLDTELNSLFKECWCKKGPPPQELFVSYRVQPPLPNESGRNSNSGNSADLYGPAAAEQLTSLTSAADTIGALLQNHHQGFLPNIRQQRAAGYAAIELGQAVRALLAERRAGREGLWVNSEGSSGQRGCSGRHLFGWRDAMDIVVKWRQLSEPADQVVWVDLLTQREFEQGFGSHTPMYSGQTKCVRYYMSFHRAMDLAKECLLERGHAYDAQNREVPLGSDDKQEAVKKAKTALELYRIIGQDSWVVVPLFSILKASKQQQQQDSSTSTTSNSSSKMSSATNATSTINSSSSTSRSSTPTTRKRVSDAMVPAGCVEGTRLTLVKVPNQPDAVEFSIRTPVTPPRWKEFDAELEAGWERLIDALLTGDKPTMAAAICAYTYYWYNFMPLARGTAAVGYTTMLALFWAAGMPITTPIPTDYQVDWEAILAKHPQQFVDRLQQWFIPECAKPVTPLAAFYDPAAAAAVAQQTAAQPSKAASSSVSNGSSPVTSPRGGSSDGSSGKLSKSDHAALVAAARALPEVDGLPVVTDALSTIRHRLNALNGPDAKPV